MVWVSRTLSVRPGSFLLIFLSFLVSFFSEINAQTPPGNPTINVVDTKNEGDTVTLTCTSFGGNPLPSVRWYKNTQLVDAGSSPNGNGDGVYTIGSTTVTYNNYTFQVSRSDNAVSFICKVNNSALTNELQRSLNIEVYVPASNPLISGPVPQVTTALDAGRTYNYTCTASSGYPVANINWKLGTSLVNSVDLHQGMSGRTVRVSESTATNSDSTLTKISQLSWIPITADNGKVLFCVMTQQVVSGGSITTATKSQSAAVFVQQIPIVQVNSSSYTIQVGQTVTMGCTVLTALPPPSTVYWSRLVNGAFNRLVIDNVRFFGSTVSNASLTISNVALSDATSYQCSATNTAGTGNSGATTLTVTGNLAQVRITQSRYTVLYGGSVYMECTVQNALPPVTAVRWYKGTSLNNINTSIDVTTSKFSGGVLSNPSLNITNVIPSDEGYYSCNATNLVGIASATTFLDVFGDLPSVILGNTSYTVMVGDPVTLSCDYNSSPSPSTITWQRILNAQSSNINVLDSRYGGGTIITPYLTIHATLLSDAGVYTCSVTNQVGTSTSQPIFLFVNGSIPSVSIPQSTYSVNFGDPITIPCNVTAIPIATNMSWVKTSNGVSVTLDPAAQPSKYSGATLSNPNLTISSTALTDEGNYVCSASNIVGTGSSNSALLDVIGDAATVTVSPPSQSVLQKSTAVISCRISNANPAITDVTWEKVSSGVTTSITVTGRFNGSTPSVPDLTISNLEPGDAGTYYCSARNAIGTTRSNTGSVLIVTGAVPSSVLIAGLSNRNVNLGGALTLQCSGQGQPSPTFTWLFSSSTTTSTVVGTGNTYTITNALRTNAGTYICRATNSLGTLDSPGVNVNVQYAPVDARTEAQKIVTATVDTAVTLNCNVDANPTASYQWYRNSQLVGSQQAYTFTFSGTDTQGVYTCRATNSIGSQDLQFTVSQGTGSVGASTASSGLSTGEIAAIILALLLLLLLIIIIIICCLTHGVCGAICGKKQDVKGRVEPTKEKEVYKETQKEVIIPRFHEESIKGKSYREPTRAGSYRSYPAHANKYRQPSAVSRKDVDVRVQNGGFRKENDYEIVRYETVPPVSTQLMTESPRPHRLPALSYTYEDVEKKRKRRKKKKHHRRRHHDHGEEVVVETLRSGSPVRIIQEPVEEVVVERVIRSRSASPTRIIRTEAEEPRVVERVIRSSSPSRHVYRQEVEEPVEYSPSPGRRGYGYYDDERIIETTRSSRSPRRHRHEEEEDVIIERRSPSTKRRYEENYITDDRDIIQEDGDLRAYNGVVYREAPSRHGSGRYAVQSSERRSRSRGRHESDDDVEVVYGKEYVVER